MEKDRFRVPPRLVWEKGRGGVVWFNVCEAPLDDWSNGGSVDVLFTCREEKRPGSQVKFQNKVL